MLELIDDHDDKLLEVELIVKIPDRNLKGEITLLPTEEEPVVKSFEDIGGKKSPSLGED